MSVASHQSHYQGYSRLVMNRMGLWLFIVSESALFSVFLFSRYYLIGTYKPEGLNILLGFVITAILLSSSFFAYMAEKYVNQGNRTGFIRSLLITILLGGIFIVGVGIEWSEALEAFPPPNIFGTVFFALTGLHLFHLFSGLILLTLVYFQVRRGSFSADSYWGVEAVVLYWHFVDVAWLFVFPTLYLV